MITSITYRSNIDNKAIYLGCFRSYFYCRLVFGKGPLHLRTTEC
jgi:hypothetical protein